MSTTKTVTVRKPEHDVDVGVNWPDAPIPVPRSVPLHLCDEHYEQIVAVREFSIAPGPPLLNAGESEMKVTDE